MDSAAPIDVALLSRLSLLSRTNFGLPVVPDVDRQSAKDGWTAPAVGVVGTQAGSSAIGAGRSKRFHADIVGMPADDQIGSVRIANWREPFSREIGVEQSHGNAGFEAGQVGDHVRYGVVHQQEGHTSLEVSQ